MRDESGREKCLLMACYGRQLDISVLQAINSMYVIRNKVYLYGDILKQLAFRTGEVASYRSWYDEDSQTAYCEVKRKGYEAMVTGKFSIVDAERAGLFKNPVWKNYPGLMCQHRASGWALRQLFPDAFSGMTHIQDASPQDQKEFENYKNTINSTCEFNGHSEERSMNDEITALLNVTMPQEVKGESE